jgi:hypothetical protein
VEPAWSVRLYLATPHTYKAVFLQGGGKTLECECTWRGGASRPYVYDDMNLYLAAPNTGSVREHLRDVNLYLALANSGSTYPRDAGVKHQRLYVLESFFYIQDWMLPYIGKYWDFLLDSGAFTFMQKKKGGLDWDEYIARYAAFINQHSIEYFFELDIDNVVGIKEVERLRARLESLTGRQSIPVWHKSRGLDYWRGMCRDYSYISIGGIVAKEIKPADYKFFPALIDIAGENGAKVHGLGFTNLEGLTKYKFHSVDSTAWVYGNMGAFLQKFNGKTLVKIKAPEGKRMRARETAIHNFNEWVKFQRYAEQYL